MKKIFLGLLIFSLAFCSPSPSRALGLIGPPAPSNCAVTAVPLYAPWWIFARTDNLNQMFQLQAGSFSGVPDGCWQDMIKTPVETFFQEISSGYFFPSPRENHTVRIFFLYPPSGGTFELQRSVDGIHYLRYLRLQLTSCSSSKDQWVWIEVPEFQNCPSGQYSVVQILYPN